MTATVTYTLGKFVWRELFTRDVAAAKAFYSALFGWRAEDRPMGPDWSYTLWYLGDRQIGGMMDIANLPNDGAGVPPHWAVYVSVEDVDKAAERAIALGGKQVTPCMEIPNVGRFAGIQDPQGAHINLFRSAHGDEEDKLPATGEFCWENLSTTDVKAAVAFYEKVVGWKSRQMENGDNLLFTRQCHGQERELASTGPTMDGAPPHWSTFVAVEQIDEATTRAASLGAKILLAPTEIPHVGAFSVIEDPTSAVIFLYESRQR